MGTLLPLNSISPLPRAWAQQSAPCAPRHVDRGCRNRQRQRLFWLPPILLSPSTAPRLVFSCDFDTYVNISVNTSAGAHSIPRGCCLAPARAGDAHGQQEQPFTLLSLQLGLGQKGPGRDRTAAASASLWGEGCSWFGVAKAVLWVCPCALPVQVLLLMGS